MLEVETVLIQWSGQEGERVEVAGQFSSWEPLTAPHTCTVVCCF